MIMIGLKSFRKVCEHKSLGKPAKFLVFWCHTVVNYQLQFERPLFDSKTVCKLIDFFHPTTFCQTLILSATFRLESMWGSVLRCWRRWESSGQSPFQGNESAESDGHDICIIDGEEKVVGFRWDGRDLDFCSTFFRVPNGGEDQEDNYAGGRRHQQ